MKVFRLPVPLSSFAVVLCALTFGQLQRANAQRGTAASTMDAVSAWYPIHPGDTWTYQKESDDAGNTGGMAHPMTERWKTEETIASVTAIPEGTFVTTRTKVFDHVTLNGWLSENNRTKRELPESHLLIRHNCMYILDGIDAQIGLDALDAENHLSPRYRRDLLRGYVPADFCFPIGEKTRWGITPESGPDEEWVWHVRGINADPFGDRDGRTFHITTHVGSGTEIDRWFEPGVGVLQEIMEHHGYYNEDRRQLLSAVISGKSRSFDLKPAQTVAYSSLDCVGVGWKHFVREDGSPFDSEDACVIYQEVGRHLPKDVERRSRS